MQSFERRFSTPEQEQIVQLAARLQQERADALTGEELAGLASEAGIEEAFIDEAIRRLHGTPPSPRSIESPPLATNTATCLVAAFLVAQWLGLFSMMTGMLNEWNGLQWWLAIGLCFTFGAVLSQDRRHRLLSVATVLCATAVLAPLCGGFVRWVVGEVISNWPMYLSRIVVAELAATGAGWLAGIGIRRWLAWRGPRLELPQE